PGGDLTELLAAARKGDNSPDPTKVWVGRVPEQAPVVTTKGDGRFRLIGFGRERLVSLYIERPGMAYAARDVLTRVGPDKPDVSWLHYATFDYVALPSRPIRGVVRDQKTGKPLAGVEVQCRTGFLQQLAVHTDKEGRYELLGYPKVPNYRLAVRPADGQVCFAGDFEFTDTEG